MNSPKLEKTKECCNNPKTHLIFYDGADTADLPILVCRKCMSYPIFQKFIVSKFQITKNTNIRQILKNYQTG